ncbi:ABC transporter ATP-binding protein [Limnochorda pilosa]|uniref:ABC transporter ATP-binding protein n=1 Tax=Limnochorda pilosa TaxID=1555112 RepID=A0A0K2SMW5_LIMPI|nr:ABC transporter ATP-binding protein [Limnochorda pilosa]BAS28460.1 ABC transporter ATP-binding protein [Limnochorda pilosa]
MARAQPAAQDDASPATVLEARGVAVAFGGRNVIRDLTLTLRAGEIVALRGPNGSGKSTTLRTLTGMLSPSEGEIRWGVPRAQRLFVPDQPFLHEHLTLSEHVRFVNMLLGSPDARLGERERRLLERLGLSEAVDAFPGDLSRGMRQKLGLLLALLPSYRVLMLDEPFTALDGQARQTVGELLRERADQGAALLVTAHEAWETRGFDRIYRLSDGVVLEEPA